MKLYLRPGSLLTDLMFHDRAPEPREPWEYLPEAARDFIKLLDEGRVTLEPANTYALDAYYSWAAEGIPAAINDAVFMIFPSFWFEYRDSVWTLTVRARAKDTEAVIRVPRHHAEVERIMRDDMLATMRAGWMRFHRNQVIAAPRPQP